MADSRVHLYTNNASCRLGGDLTDSATSVSLEAGKGALFPDPGTDQVFALTLEHLVTGVREIMICTSRSGDTLEVERGKEGTDAVAWTSDNNVIVQHRLTAGTLDHLEAGPCVFQLACSNLISDITTGTGRGYFRAPFRFRITDIRASLTVGTDAGAFIIDVNVNGSTILSTKLTIDMGELTSVTAATPAVISNPDVGDDDAVTIDVDDADAGARGLIITIIGERI